MDPLETYAQRYRSELLDRVIPFWLCHSLDKEHGGYFTCLTREGAVYDSRKYVWLQGRAVWMFSKLYNELEPREDWLNAARSMLEFLRANARDEQGRYYFSLTREGRPSFYQRKPYAAVFAMLGMLEFSKATSDLALRREAIDLFWKILSWIEDPTLLGRPSGSLPSLADVMITASMASEIARVDDDPRYQAILQQCQQRALKFYDSKHRMFLEYAPAETPEGRLFCPGDSLEASWFLLHANPDEKMRALLLDSILGALEYGWDREHGGLYYFMDVADLPPLPLESNMKLWWPHTEAIYACVLAHSLTSDPRFLTWLERVDAYAFAHFSDQEHGEWFGYCDRRGELTNTAKGNNYKGCFHVPRMLLLSYQKLSEFQTQAQNPAT